MLDGSWLSGERLIFHRPRMSTSDLTSTRVTDLGATNKFQLAGTLTSTEPASHGDPLYKHVAVPDVGNKDGERRHCEPAKVNSGQYYRVEMS